MRMVEQFEMRVVEQLEMVEQFEIVVEQFEMRVVEQLEIVVEQHCQTVCEEEKPSVGQLWQL